jgi:VWFA-related protein
VFLFRAVAVEWLMRSFASKFAFQFLSPFVLFLCLICPVEAFGAAQINSGPVNLANGCQITGPAGRMTTVCPIAPATNSVDPQEQAAYKAFYNEDNVDAKIHLGEEFDQKYPQSIYEDWVDTALTSLYYNKQNWPKFYAAGEKVIAKNPKSLAILELVGWAIPRNSSTDPSAAAKLGEAVNYEKRALALIAAMKKPKEVDQQDFDNSIAGLSWRAYSGLGLTYFRQKDYADSAAELQIAVRDEALEPDAGDLLALGIALENLHRKREAIDAFSECFQISSDLQDSCEEDLQKAKAELAESAEDAAYEAFAGATNVDAQIQLGEKFERDYPSSQYAERVDGTLASLYWSRQDWSSFYAAAGKALAKNPDDVPVLAMDGWAISHNYDANDPSAAAKLDESEKDEKHALDLVPAIRKPATLTEDQFEQARAAVTSQAHSGLGMTYFRRNDFADSAKELELATGGATSDATEAGAFDLYILGIDLQKLNRPQEAADAFTKCSEAAGNLESQCKKDAEVASQAAGQLAAVAAKPAANSAASSLRDIPPPTTQESGPAIRAETVLVPVRVVVRDTKGRPVANLNKDDFKLYQDGKPVEMSTFTGVNDRSSSSATAAEGQKTSSSSGSDHAASAASGTATASTAAAPTQFVALFFDDVHLYFSDLAQTRNAAAKFLATLHPEDRVTIVTASGKNELDFTNDRDALEATIAKLRPEPFPGGTIAPVEGGAGGKVSDCPAPMTYTEANAIVGHNSQGVLDLAGGDFYECVYGTTLESADATKQAGEALAAAAARQTYTAGEKASDAVFARLRATVNRLSAMPGDRIIALISPGFVYSGHERDFAEIIDLALHFKVVINTLDAKGINECMYRLPSGICEGADGKWNPDRLQQFGFGHFEVEQPVLQDLADGTGGLFVKNNNDFEGALREMSEAPEAYYLLGFAPQNLIADGKYHTLKVSLARRSLNTVQARRGFYAPSHLETAEEAAKREIEDALYSQEEQHDLPVKLETVLVQDASGAEKLNVKADVDPSRLNFQKAAGLNHEDITVAAALFDQNGNYVAGTEKVDQMNLDDTTLTRLDKSGFYMELDFDVKPGDYVVRLVARDSNDGHISAENAAITVPN